MEKRGGMVYAADGSSTILVSYTIHIVVPIRDMPTKLAHSHPFFPFYDNSSSGAAATAFLELRSSTRNIYLYFPYKFTVYTLYLHVMHIVVIPSVYNVDISPPPPEKPTDHPHIYLICCIQYNIYRNFGKYRRASVRHFELEITVEL